MQRITGYKTSDGQFFEKKKVADAHESTLVAVNELNALAKNLPFVEDWNAKALDEEDFVGFCMENREALLNILKKIKE